MYGFFNLKNYFMNCGVRFDFETFWEAANPGPKQLVSDLQHWKFQLAVHKFKKKDQEQQEGLRD
jgi:hypothetical protein